MSPLFKRARALRSAPPPDTIERRVHFYRIRVQPDAGGTTRPFDPAQACALLAALQQGTPDWYLVPRDGADVCVWAGAGVAHPCVTLGGVRRSGFPFVEDRGQISPIALRSGQGLVEQTHVVFFPDGIVGAEANFYGPRVARLGEYLAGKAPTLPRVEFAILLRTDVLQQLRHLGEIRLFTMRLHRSELSLPAETDQSLEAGLRAAADDLDAPVVEFTAKVPRYSRVPLGERVRRLLGALAANPRTYEGGFEELKASGVDDRTGRLAKVDLLRDQLVETCQVVRLRPGYRAVDSESMFGEIVGAYHRVRDQLPAAPGLGE